VRCFVGQISWPASPASLPDGSGCWIRLIRKPVLWQWASHLLLKYTESGYETVLTAACARQGCSATEWVSEWVQWGCIPGSIWLRGRALIGSCEYGNEPSGSERPIKGSSTGLINHLKPSGNLCSIRFKIQKDEFYIYVSYDSRGKQREQIQSWSWSVVFCFRFGLNY
jgi:hypothetical protein